MLKQYKKIIGTVLKSAPGESVIIILMAILVGVVEGVCTQLTIEVYDAIGRFSYGKGSYLVLFLAFGIYALLSPHYYLYLPMDEFMRSVLMQKLQKRLMERLFHCVCEGDLGQLEDPELYERVTKASEDTIHQKYRKIIDATIYIPLNISCFIAVLVVLAAHSYLLAAIALIGLIPTFIARVLEGKGYFALYNGQTKNRQYLTYLWELLCGYGVNRDMKVLDHGEYLRNKYTDLLKQTVDEEWSLEKKNFFRTLILDSLQPLSIAIAILLSILLITNGDISVAVFAALLQAMISVNETSSSIIVQCTDMITAMPYLNQFFEYVEASETEKNQRTKKVTGFHTMEFDQVSFHYPGKEKNVLENVSFVLHEKESIALVGENGSGKSTLIKLMLRIYRPTEGRILLDGVDINEIEDYCFYDKISAVFQNYVRYQFSLRENVAMSNLTLLNEDEILMKQLSRYEMDNVAAGLPQKLDTILGREFGEVDLSGGQWQKLAIARGGLKPSSLIILDEPTASIDPITESEIFERFKQFTKECCSVIISHRIGAARIANRILVLEQGHLIEDGTHEELMKQQGVYQKLYEIQAQWYVS